MVNKIASLKTVGIENTNSKWFDREKAEKLSLSNYLSNSNQVVST